MWRGKLILLAFDFFLIFFLPFFSSQIGKPPYVHFGNYIGKSTLFIGKSTVRYPRTVYISLRHLQNISVVWMTHRASESSIYSMRRWCLVTENVKVTFIQTLRKKKFGWLQYSRIWSPLFLSHKVNESHRFYAFECLKHFLVQSDPMNLTDFPLCHHIW